jgi:hypothetical protein
MMTHPHLPLRSLFWCFLGFPFAAAADAGLLATRLGNLDATEYHVEFGDSGGNLYLQPRDAFVDWQPGAGHFFTTAGVLRGEADADAIEPASHVSLKPLKPLLETYLGVGWRGGNLSKKLKWMVDLGLIHKRSPRETLSANADFIQRDASGDSGSRNALHYRLSTRGTFSLRLRF